MANTSYYVRFHVHLKPSSKPEGWPPVVFHDMAFDTTDWTDFRKKLNMYMYTFVRQQGVVILKESKEPQGNDIRTLDLRRFVPMHMIAWIEHETKRIEEEKPATKPGTPFEEGEEDGSNLFN